MRAQSTKSINPRELGLESKGKKKITSEKRYTNKDIKSSGEDLKQRIDTWLRKGESSTAGDHEPHYRGPSSGYEKSYTSTPQISIFDGDIVENRSADEKGENDVFEPGRVNLSPKLPCEFFGHDGCFQEFDITAVNDWIEHTLSIHLGGNPPHVCACWFCDDYVFRSRDYSDRRACFESRMWHIRNHMLEDGSTVHDIRPDYYMLDHVYEHGLISTDVYNLSRTYSEVQQPQEVRPFDFITPEAERTAQLSKRVVIHQAEEDRIRRRSITPCREKLIQERYQSEEKRYALDSSPTTEVYSQLEPPQLDSYEELRDQGESRNSIVGLDTLAPWSDQVVSTDGNKIQQFTSGKNDVLEPLYSGLDEFFEYNLRLPPSSRRRRSPRKLTDTPANHIDKRPKITYGPTRDGKGAKISRSPSMSSRRTAVSLRKSPRRKINREEQSWLRVFGMALLGMRIPFPQKFTRLYRLFWPRQQGHLERVSWICRCGQPLYIDVYPAERQLAIEYAKAASGSPNSITVSRRTATRTSLTQTNSSLSSPVSQTGTDITNTTGHAPAQVQPSSTFTPPVLDRGTKRYLLLCVNTGHFEIKLEQIDLTNIVLDVSMFSLIRETYESMRGSMMKSFFMVPKTVEYVKVSVLTRCFASGGRLAAKAAEWQFELVRRSSTGECVGNFEKDSIPGQNEVAKKEYTFSPCPPRIGKVPIQPHIFMHSFLNPGDHLGELALLQLPKKVGRKLKCVTQPRDPFDVPYGWGIYIVEGLNTFLVTLLLIGVLAVLSLIVLLWSILKRDVQGGTGIGQYGLAVMGMVIVVCTFTWEPLRGRAS
ncbi:hypothetical protein F4825DRAFT_469884 [Nemania diffusa]|nr:hypothetical protein F4825DRAFT_469884 [Nemania diffusa]